MCIAAMLFPAAPFVGNGMMVNAADDIGLWVSADVEKKITKKWSVEAEGELRMKDNVSTVDRFSIGISTSYKLNKWLKADAGYDYLHSREEGGVTESGKYYNSTYWYPRHRVHASLTESFKAGRFRISVRERWVYTYTPEFNRNRLDMRTTSSTYGQVLSKTLEGECENVLRLKLNVEYNIRKSSFTPFVSAEAYLPFTNVCFGQVTKMRYSVGTEYKLSKKQQLKVYYLFQDKTHKGYENPVDMHVFGAGYSYSF